MTNGANLQCHVPTPGTPPFPAHLCHPTPADHSSGSLAAETLDEPFSLGSHAFFFHQATSSWGWGLVSLSGCGLSSTGLARSYVYCGWAQEEGIGNSVGEGSELSGIGSASSWVPHQGLATGPGHFSLFGHKRMATAFVLVASYNSSSGDLVSDTYRPLSGLGSHCLLHRRWGRRGCPDAWGPGQDPK